MTKTRGLIARLTERVDHKVGWDKLPLPLGILELISIRETLREDNLHDTGGASARSVAAAPAGDQLAYRTADGTFNDLQQPQMGAVGARFGRNVPVDRTWPEPKDELLSPSPRTVSQELLVRREFIPATTLNVLAATWLQFQVRDWFRHEQVTDDPWELSLAEDDPWPERPMKIRRTAVDPTGEPGTPPVYANTETHWWDASQLYGSDEEFQRLIRSGIDGKLRLRDDGLLPVDPTTLALPGGVDGWWLGMAAMHVLFMREHNSVCDRLKAEYPTWSDDDLFGHARLVIAALIAKIHTVEWTPAILGHPALQIAMRANWWGIVGERLSSLVSRYTGNEVLRGIPGSPTNHHTAPYALTEEFVAVYRMHPLVPDDFSFHAVADDAALGERTLIDLFGRATQGVLDEFAMGDILYSFGVAHPGAVTLHNFPRSLCRLETIEGELLDLGAIDILRSRERAVPRYCDFRRQLHLTVPSTFEELTGGDLATAAELRRVYGDVERVDLSVGMFAEPLPAGFGFSDTAFRIFILMASRRLKSDRFFTTDFNPVTYTPAGFQWVKENDMRSVLLRHFPELAPALEGVANPFAPWRRTGAGAGRT